MSAAVILFASVAFAAQTPQPPTTRPPNQPACAQVSADALTDTAVGEICAGDDAARLANTVSADASAKKRAWQSAAEHYRKASTLTTKSTTKLLALNALADLYDARRLDDVNQMQTTLRELIALAPDDFSYLYRLARVQEDHGLTDAAEDTLLQARRGKPDEVEPYRQLAQFYSRRVTATALRKQEAQAGALGGTRPGEPDENGVYRVGGSVVAPTRVDIPYPPEALAAGAQGVVIMEVTIDAVGGVSNAKVVRSVPMLDGAAVQGVSNWHFQPTVVNGQAAPVKMMVTVNFVPPQTSQQAR